MTLHLTRYLALCALGGAAVVLGVYGASLALGQLGELLERGMA